MVLFGLLAGPAAPARAQPAEIVYATPKGVLASFFPKSDRVTYRTLALDAGAKARLEHLRVYGPTPHAFTFREKYPAPGGEGTPEDMKPESYCVGWE